MGGTLRPDASPDFSRFDTKKSDTSSIPDDQPTSTPPKMSETVVQSDQEGRNSTIKPQEATKSDSTNGADAPKDRGTPSTAKGNEEVKPSVEATQQPQASGWLGWLGMSSQVSQPPMADVPKDEVMEVDPPKEPENVQPNPPEQTSPEPTLAPGDDAGSTKPATSWFGFWYSSAPATTVPVPSAQMTTNLEVSAQESAPQNTEDVVMEDAPQTKALEVARPSGSSTWAFWSRDTSGPKDEAKTAGASEPGELAIIGDGSEAHPKRSSSAEVDGNPSLVKEPSSMPKEIPAKAILSKRNKRVRPQSIDIDNPISRPGTPHSDISTKTTPSRSTIPTQSKSSAPNSLLPSFRNTYRMKNNPSIIKQITQLLLRTQQPPANHVFLVKEPPKIKKAVAIGIRYVWRFIHLGLVPKLGI